MPKDKPVVCRRQGFGEKLLLSHICADRDCEIDQLLVNTGDQVRAKDLLIILKEAST